MTEWAIPGDAIGEVPTTTGCDTNLLTWLESNTEPLRREMSVTMRNDAAEGPMLALVDFRAVATTSEERGPVSVRLVCDPSGSVPSQIYYGRIDVDNPEQAAYHAQLKTGPTATAAQRIPVTFNLAPGESGTVPLTLFSRSPASGELAVTVLSRQEEQVVTIPDSEFEVPALLFGGSMYFVATADNLVCLQTERGTIEDCTLEDIARELAAARP